MKGSTTLWALMAAAPVLFLGLLAIVGRTQVNTWQFEEIGEEEGAKLTAYTQVVAEARIAARPKTEADRVEEIALGWIQGRKAGTLQDILPGSTADQGDQGIKGEIVRARQEVVMRLVQDAHRDVVSGLPRQAARRLALAASVSDTLKYSGYHSMTMGAVAQMTALRGLNTLLPQLSQDEKEATVAILSDIRTPEAPAEEINDQLSRLQIRRDALYETSFASLRGYHLPNSLAVSTFRTSLPGQQDVRGLELLSEGITLSQELLVALRSEAAFQRELKRLLTALDPVGSPVASQNQESSRSSKDGMEQDKQERNQG
jgi:hypothetical protein